MSEDSIIEVSITRQTQAVAQASFDVPLLAAYHAVFPERVREYDISSGLDGLVSDGFTSSSAVYEMASAFAAQNPKISTIKVGRRALAPTQTIDITPAAQNSTEYSVIINGTEFTYDSDSDATVAEITAGLVAAINAGSVPVTATDNTTKITLTADVAGAMFTLELNEDYDGADLWTRDDVTTDPGIATDLAAIKLVDNAWYGLCIDSQSGAEITAAATWAESNNKLFAATTGDSDVVGSGSSDVASTVSASNRDRSFICYDKHPHDRLAEAWMGLMMTKDPGTATWKFKTPSGPAAGTYTSTIAGYLEDKNCNYFSEVGGVDIMQQGVVASGSFIDEIRGVDWFKTRLQERIYSQLVNLDKIPFTNAGIGVIENEIWAQIREGIDKGFLGTDTPPTVTVPDSTTVSTTDKANRTLPDVEFTAVLAGAIHQVQISGVVSL